VQLPLAEVTVVVRPSLEVEVATLVPTPLPLDCTDTPFPAVIEVDMLPVGGFSPGFKWTVLQLSELVTVVLAA
jgi:hypothetical protein